MTEFEHVTNDAFVETFSATTPIFKSILREVKELSRKKPEATMSNEKVTLINRILTDLLLILKDEPEGKYLEELDDQKLPQISDAVLVMVQFDTALSSFESKYHRYIGGDRYWITDELLKSMEDDEEEGEEERGEEEEEESDDHDGQKVT